MSGYESFRTKKDLTFDNGIYTLFLALMLLTATTVFIHSVFKSDPKNIWKNFLDLEQTIIRRLGIEIQFDEFNRKYLHKVCCALFVFSWLCTVKFASRINANNLWQQISGLMLLVVVLLPNFHVLFYVSLFNYIVRLINQQLVKLIDPEGQIFQKNKDKKTAANLGQQIAKHFKILKLIHYKLWEIVQLISAEFGIILILLMISNANTSIQTFYWVIVELYEDDLRTNLRIMSKYVSDYLDLGLINSLAIMVIVADNLLVFVQQQKLKY